MNPNNGEKKKENWKLKEDVSDVATTPNMIFSVTYYWIHTVLYPFTIEFFFYQLKLSMFYNIQTPILIKF